jgi:hypothetical protein
VWNEARPDEPNPKDWCPESDLGANCPKPEREASEGPCMIAWDTGSYAAGPTRCTVSGVCDRKLLARLRRVRLALPNGVKSGEPGSGEQREPLGR